MPAGGFFPLEYFDEYKAEYDPPLHRLLQQQQQQRRQGGEEGSEEGGGSGGGGGGGGALGWGHSRWCDADGSWQWAAVEVLSCDEPSEIDCY